MPILDRILETASRRLPATGIDCLLIGGFAVNHYGYTRNTLDIDFMIVADRIGDVRKIMCDAGFINVEIHDNVAFFSDPEGGPRVDFLRVDSETMRELLACASSTDVDGHSLRIPSLKDLIAMKIFALGQDKARRMGKDLPDIAYLSVINRLDVERDIRPLCKQFGSQEIFALVRDQIAALEES